MTTIAEKKTAVDKVTEFKERGFVIVPNALDMDYLQDLRQFTERIISYANQNLEDPFARYYSSHRAQHGALFDVFQRHPEFGQAARNPKVLDIIEQIVGPDIYAYENTVIFKSSQSANAVPWHQDFINRPHEPKKVMAWYALDNIRASNGAMKVIPGSHKSGFLPFHHVGGTYHTLVKPEYVDESKAIYAELDAGSCLIFDQLLLHSSEEVRSGEPRRAFRMSYQGFDAITAPRGTPFVIRGGSPEAMARRFPRTSEEASEAERMSKKGVMRRILNRAGRFLASF